jgi:uncharacterized membrane protein YozB (DUF420 family)
MAGYGIDLFTLATIDDVIETIAYVLVLLGFYFARKNNFKRHGILTMTATLLVFVSLFLVMLSVFYYTISGISLSNIDLISSIIILHHSLGLITIVMSLVSISTLRPCGSIMGNQKFGGVRRYMLTLITIWSITYFLGLIIHLILYYSLSYV